MSNIKFTEEERKTVWDIVTEYTNLNSSAATLKTEILSNKETVAELIDKLQNGKIAEGEDPVILNERLGNIMQNHQDHSLALNNIIEELGIGDKSKCMKLLKESKELTAIFTATARTTKENK